MPGNRPAEEDGRGGPIHRLILDNRDIAGITALLDELTAAHSSVEQPEFQRDLTLYAQELPRGLRRFVNDFRLAEPAGACLVSGYPVDDAAIGPTPRHWNPREGTSPTLREEMFALMCGALLGDPFAWATQQDGYLVHDVVPVPEHADRQLGTGSNQTLVWHTEDAFHPSRADYIGLFCLRNPDETETTYAGVDSLDLDPSTEVVRTLFEPLFHLQPDGSHMPREQDRTTGWFEGGKELAEQSYRRIVQMLEDPEPVAMLLGAPDAPYLCVDPYFRDLDRLDSRARAAYDWLLNEIDTRLERVVFHPGDCFFVDNYRAVHGRNSFKARHDGTDRWLKRVSVTRDLRKSRASRLRADARIVF
ncbi:guanitoxin biosynthesis L-enduracididine beta-hydroxylase GntD [Streptomyces sp. NPDC087298]|uniref:guanitoxin biosynthesis L-enduracididine beta-hydroxylase GntD n=1 Tax=Streptomyces sp. NPDC087298 TaxID=3365779 RepID=UPI003822313B